MDLQKLDHIFEKTLEESRALLDDASRVAEEDYEFTLESILAEFGGEEPPAEPTEPTPLPPLPEESDEPEDEEPDGDGAEGVVPSLDTPQSYSLQEVLERTVRNVLDEQETEPPEEEPPKRRGLFSRLARAEAERETVYGDKSADGERVSAEADEPRVSEPQDEPEEPEPPIEETVADYRAAAQSAHRASRWVAFITALMWAPSVLEHFGLMPARYAAESLLNTAPFLAALALACLLGREVFVFAAEKLAERKVTYELLTALLCLAALGDAALALFNGTRAASAALPLHTVAATSLACAMRGRATLFKALYDSFRVAAMGDAPYIVTTTAGGAAKRRGRADGFSITAQRDDVSGRWQAVTLPVVLMGALVFSVLSTVQAGSWTLWCWNLSAILAGGNALAFPLVYAMPLRRVTRRFTKSGSALAGYRGAVTLCRSNCLILTDSDLFPPGTMAIEGIKLFGEEGGKAITYAATMAHASDMGVSRLFDRLLAQEGGRPETLSDLNFYEEGGVGGTIHGETVLFGTAAFCRRMGVTLPSGIKLRTGLYLAVDGALIAVFAVKYMAAENVDWALHALARAHITPVLAVRDGNITPALLKSRFNTDAHAVYPRLSTRLVLSERDGAKPCALIFREGLMPYAELAVGSKRLCRAVRAGNALSLVTSAVGTTLSFYLSFLGAYSLLTPLKLACFLGLLAVSALVGGFFADRY